MSEASFPCQTSIDVEGKEFFFIENQQIRNPSLPKPSLFPHKLPLPILELEWNLQSLVKKRDEEG